MQVQRLIEIEESGEVGVSDIALEMLCEFSDRTGDSGHSRLRSSAPL
jgi:hypothetical protein